MKYLDTLYPNPAWENFVMENFVSFVFSKNCSDFEEFQTAFNLELKKEGIELCNDHKIKFKSAAHLTAFTLKWR